MKHGSMPLAVAMSLLLAGGVSAQGLITFEPDPAGNVPNGYSPVGHPDVRVSDSMGEDLQIADYLHQSHLQALATFFDDFSYLIIDFLTPVDLLELWFGNDDPGAIRPGQDAILTVFMDGVFVGESRVPVNANDFMDQFIVFTGATFNRAHFTYETALIEVVDDIVYRQAQQVVPEPITTLLFGTGLFGVAAARRRRKVTELGPA